MRAYQALEARSSDHIRSLGLTPAQFDVIAALGDAPGMTPTQLTNKTLITKGTLTGVVDRLVAKGLLRRTQHQADRRCQFVTLTKKGSRLYQVVVPAHFAYLDRFVAGYSVADHAQAQAVLMRLTNAFGLRSA
jgi:DNA-binding MarR family transcriptional regulator